MTRLRLVGERPHEAPKQSWECVREIHPDVHAQAAARRPSFSEAERVATGGGHIATRLAGDWGDLIKRLPALGQVMTLTRNAGAVHAYLGAYEHIDVDTRLGRVQGEGLDLRLFFAHWSYGYAVREPTRSGLRRSLQFFAQDGTAVHKVYVTDESDLAAYEALVERSRSCDQSTHPRISGMRLFGTEQPDAEVNVAGLRAGWDAMWDTHQFHLLLARFGVSRLQGLRLAGPERAYEVHSSGLSRVLGAVRDAAVAIAISVASRGANQTYSGRVRNLCGAGHWYNVLDPHFNLHVHTGDIAGAWVVVKPSAHGPITSLELYDPSGGLLLQVLGERAPDMAEGPVWREIVTALPPLHQSPR